MTIPVLSVRNLRKEYPVGRGRRLVAVDEVSFDVDAGEIVAVVGESGSGKTTTAMCAVHLEQATSGSVRVEGTELAGQSRRHARNVLKRIGVVFQDPHSSMNPRHTIGRVITEPLAVHRIGDDEGRRARAIELLELVGLNASSIDRYPHQFSGGQRQRLAIARALACDPALVVADEPVSSLDVSVQAHVLNLFSETRIQLGVSYLFIAHDLAVVRQLAQRVVVMYLGRAVEIAPVERLFATPRHPYTAALLSAAPLPDPVRERRRERIVLVGDPPSPVNPPTGCGFNTRCWRADERCRAERPALVDDGTGASFACHHPLPADAAASSVAVGLSVRPRRV